MRGIQTDPDYVRGKETWLPLPLGIITVDHILSVKRRGSEKSGKTAHYLLRFTVSSLCIHCAGGKSAKEEKKHFIQLNGFTLFALHELINNLTSLQL